MAFCYHVINKAGILMRETVVILAPDMRCQKISKRGDGTAPGDLLAYLEPFGVLIEHRINNMDECFVTRKKTMASGEQITLEPTLTCMLGKNFHYPPVRRQMFILGQGLCNPGSGRHLKQGVQPV